MDNSDASVDYAQYTTSWQTPSSNWKTTTNGNFTTSNYQAADRIFAHWSESVAGDYGNVDWEYIIVPEKLAIFLIIFPISLKLYQNKKSKKKLC